MSFELPKLPYTLEALEPHIDSKTMEIHHGKHHQAYVTNLNKAIEGTNAANLSIEEICQNISSYSPAIRNNGGGHYNHSLFWNVMSPESKSPEGDLLEAINSAFNSLDDLKSKFSTAGATRFGSGWAWMIVNGAGQLEVCSTPNQDNPLMDIAEVKGTPILGMDVWEHAYYLNYQNRRPDYISAFWQLINWDEVARRYKAVK